MSPSAHNGRRHGCAPKGRAAAAALRAWAFSLCPISQQNRRQSWRRCDVIGLLIWSYSAGRKAVLFLLTTKNQANPKRRNQRTNPRATNTSCAGVRGLALSISQRFCPHWIGNGMVIASTQLFPTGKNGRKTRTPSRLKSPLWSRIWVGIVSRASGRWNTRLSGSKSSGIGCRIGIVSCGSGKRIRSISSHGLDRGGRNSRAIRPSMPPILRVEIRRVERGILRCMRPRLRSLLRSMSAAGGATSTVPHCLPLKTCNVLARSPIAKTFGGLECFAGPSAAKSANGADVLRVFRGSFLGGLNVSSLHGYVTALQPRRPLDFPQKRSDGAIFAALTKTHPQALPVRLGFVTPATKENV